jgi:hypothetical protein
MRPRASRSAVSLSPKGGEVLIGVRPKLLATVAAAGSIAIAVAGCGSSSSATPAGGDPASIVPASAPLYATAIVRPGGSLKSSLDSVSQKLLHVSDPSARIQALIAPGLRRQGLDYKRDIQPWLGSRIGAFFTSLSGPNGPDGAAVIPATDIAKARAALARDSHAKGSPRNYRGVSYTLSGTTAQGIVGSYVVIGSDAGIHSVIDVKDGAASLAASSSYTSALANVARSSSSSSSIATLYAQPRALLSAAVQAASTSTKARSRGTAAVLQRLLGIVKSNAVVATVTLDPHVVGLQASSSGSQPSTAGGGGADTLAALPGDAWLALGAGDIGAALTKDLASLGSLAQAGGSQLNLRGLLNPARGVSLARDLLSWAGNTGVFIRGTGLTDLGVAVVISSKNRAASRAAVPRIAALLKGLLGKGSTSRPLSLPGTDAGMSITPARVPLAIDVVDGGGKFVIGLGDASVNQALHPTGRFGDSAAFRAAAAALGGGARPVFVLDFGGALTLLDGLGLNNSNASFAKALPYLRALSTFAIGVGHSGTQTLVRVALGLH